MNKELIKHMYNKATDACIAKAEKDNSLAWTFEEEYARVIIQECWSIIVGDSLDMCSEQRLRWDIAADVKDHFGIPK